MIYNIKAVVYSLGLLFVKLLAKKKDLSKFNCYRTLRRLVLVVLQD